MSVSQLLQPTCKLTQHTYLITDCRAGTPHIGEWRNRTRLTAVLHLWRHVVLGSNLKRLVVLKRYQLIDSVGTVGVQ